MGVAATVAADGDGISVLSPIAGVPMLVRAVRAVLDAGVASRVLVDAPAVALDVLQVCAGLPVDLAQARQAVGAHTGQRGTPGDGSVAPDVLVRHDARRPLTPPAVIAAVVDAVLAGHAAAVPVLPLTDTVKIVDSGGLVRGSPDRDLLRVVQSPRAWRAGCDVAVTHAVPGHPLAMSVRTAWDLELAELMLAER